MQIIKKIFLWIVIMIMYGTITYPIYFISFYLNPKTYTGSVGHNNGIVVLCITLPIFFLISRAWKKKKMMDAYYASVVVIIAHVFLFGGITVTEL